MASRKSGADEGYNGAPRHRNTCSTDTLGTNRVLSPICTIIRYPRLVRPPGRALALDAQRGLASRPEAQEIVRISTQLHALRKLSGREPRTRHTQTARATCMATCSSPGDPAPCHTQPCVRPAFHRSHGRGTARAHAHGATWHADHTPSSQTEHCPAYTHMLNSHVHHLAHLPCPHATSL